MFVVVDDEWGFVVRKRGVKCRRNLFYMPVIAKGEKRQSTGGEREQTKVGWWD